MKNKGGILSTSIFEMLPTNQVKLDRENPRIARFLEMYGDEISSDQMALALGSGSSEGIDGGPSYNDLKQSIQTNKGIIHPIIVNRNNDNITVIEGNTRLLIYREFSQDNIEGKWDDIPSMVYTNLEKNKIDAIRLQSHLVGTRNWDPYSKAKYLNHLRNSENLTFGQIVDFCGGKRREIQNYINAYQDMKKYYCPLLDSDQDIDPTRFSSFVELQENRVISAILDSGYNKKVFSEWVIDHKLIPIPNIRQLPKILRNNEAKKIFLKYDSKKAIEYLASLNVKEDGDQTLTKASLLQLTRALTTHINQQLKYSDIKRFKEQKDTEEVEYIFEANDAISALCKDIKMED